MALLDSSTGFTPLDRDAACSYTLPSFAYTDASVFAREKEAIFYRTWQLLGHVGDLAQPGQYVAGWIADQHVFVIRGRDGALRGFYNVCQHRAHELVQGRGRCSTLVCPYHAWSYHLDGRLKTARRAETMPGFARERFSLVPVRVETVHGLVFVNLDAQAAPLAELAPTLAADLAASAPALPDYEHYGTVRFPQAINWKTRIDNSLECYHCENAHPGFARMVDLGVYQVEERPYYSRQEGAVRATEAGPAGMYVYWQIWPCIELRNMSSVGLFNLFRHRPVAVDQLEMEVQVYGLPGPDAEARLALARQWADTDFVREDIALCASVQRGLNSRGYRQGRFFVEEGYRTEQLVHSFHRKVAAALEL